MAQVLRDAESVARFHAHWNQRIDALDRGVVSDEEFIAEVMRLDREARESPWAVIAIMDRRVRRGTLDEEMFRGIEARIAQREFAPDAELTIDMPAPMPPPAPVPRIVTQRIRQLTPEEFEATQRLLDAPPLDATQRIEPPLFEQPPYEFAPPAQPVAPPEASFADTSVLEPAVIQPHSLAASPDEPVSIDAPPMAPLQVPTVHELAAGTVLAERYVIRGIVGEGGMARVYQALDRQRRDQGDVDWHVAVKVLHESTQDYPQAFERLSSEFDGGRRLNHRHIIRVFEMGRDGPLDFFTMEFLFGEPLSKFLARFHGEPLPRDEAWSMIRDIGAALAHAHEQGVVHGDLQPQNIMVLKSGELKLMDFGAGAGGEFAQVTPGYASLEQLAGLAPAASDDLYALACLGYELLAGAHPYGGRRASEAKSLGLVPESPRGLRPSQWQWLQQALAFERAARPVSVHAWLEGLGLEVAPAPIPPRVPFAFEQAAAPLSVQIVTPAPAELPPEAPPVEIAPPVLEVPDMSYVPDAAAMPAAEPTASQAPAAAVELATELPRIRPEVIEALPPLAAPPRTPEPRPAPSLRLSPRVATRVIAVAAGAVIVGVGAVLWHRQAGDNDMTTLPAESTLPAPPPAAAPVAPAPAAAPAAAAPKAVAHAKPRPAAPPGGTVALAGTSYHVPPGARFAEVHVTRTDAGKPLSFTWWTEDGTALAGFDFIGVPKSTAYMAAGARSATLFVKIAGGSPRKQPVHFAVQIAHPSVGVLGDARMTVTLPAGR